MSPSAPWSTGSRKRHDDRGTVVAERTDHHVPHAVACRALEVPASTFYKSRDRPLTARQLRRAELDAVVNGVDAVGRTSAISGVLGKGCSS
jgi:hypothetical protein